MNVRRSLLDVVLLAVLVSTGAASALQLERLQGSAATLSFDGPQYVQADARGDVFLLRGDTLQVYPIVRHDLGEPVQLDVGVRTGPPIDAAMNRDDGWAVVLGGTVHLFTAAGHEKPLPTLGWLPVNVGFVRDDPAAIVAPRHGDPLDEPPPLVLRLGIDTWSAELREPLHGKPLDIGTERAHRAALVLDAREGRYFLAREYAYRIELRRLGRPSPLEELRLGRGEPILRPEGAGDADRALAQARADGVDTSHGSLQVFRGSFALLALARGGPEQRLYAVVGPGVAGDGCALDRIDWEAHRVERVGLDMPCPGRVSLAAGRDGLYLAGFSGTSARYFVAWSALEAARWAPVKDARFTP